MLDLEQLQATCNQAIESGNLQQAEQLWKHALQELEQSGEQDRRLVLVLESLADVLSMQERYKEAEPLLARAVELTTTFFGPDHVETAISLNKLAGVYFSLSRYRQAEPLSRKALAIYEKSKGTDHYDAGCICANLARLLDAQGDQVRAEPMYKRAITIKSRVLGQSHAEVLALIEPYALMLELQGRIEEADELRREKPAQLPKVRKFDKPKRD